MSMNWTCCDNARLSARYEKARRGELIVAAPIGFVKAGDQFEKDPDRACSEAIALVFAKVTVGSAASAAGSTSTTWICRPRPSQR